MSGQRELDESRYYAISLCEIFDFARRPHEPWHMPRWITSKQDVHAVMMADMAWVTSAGRPDFWISSAVQAVRHHAAIEAIGGDPERMIRDAFKQFEPSATDNPWGMEILTADRLLRDLEISRAVGRAGGVKP